MSMRHSGWKQLEIIIDPSQLLQVAERFDGSVYLKSGSSGGRYDIFSTLPESRLLLESRALLETTSLSSWHTIAHDARLLRQTFPTNPALMAVPFASGLMGYVSYEAAVCIQEMKTRMLAESALPSLFICYCSWSYVYDHCQRRGYLTFSPACADASRETILGLLTESRNVADSAICVQAPVWRNTISFDDYAQRFAQAKSYIEAGDVYQINLAQMFTAQSQCSQAALFEQLSQRIQPPYSAFIHPDTHSSILSFSPEQFIAVQGQKIITRPIKGTVRNSGNESDIHTLLHSEKNRAENVMIVDLMRNDLGRVCRNFSVRVSSLCKVESFRNVHHLVSTIEGELRDDCDALDAFFTCLPGGSITGAPKRRAIEIINELEWAGRNAYCGSAFYYSDTGNFDSNILIRSIVQSGEQLFCWGGGGIVADSVPEEEYAESLIKVQNLTGLGPQ